MDEEKGALRTLKHVHMISNLTKLLSLGPIMAVFLRLFILKTQLFAFAKFSVFYYL